jgi:hypothetical protein
MYNSRPEWERQIRAQVEALYAKGGWRDILGGDFVMEPADAVVVQEATKPTARPPFEWLFEITSEINTGTAMRHYLLREEDIVLAERRTLTPIDEAEAQVILDDLALVEATLAE